MEYRVRSLALSIAIVLMSQVLALPSVQGQSVRVENTSVRRVAAMVAEGLEVDLDIDARVLGRVDVEIRHGAWRDALSHACNQARCRWELVESDPLKLVIRPLPDAKPVTDILAMELETPVTLHVANLPVADVLGSLVELMAVPLKLTIEPDLDTRITLDARDRSWKSIVDDVCRQARCTWEVDTVPSPRLVVERRME